MAQRVRYFQDDVEFTEGPFVMVNVFGWRIECELPNVESGCNCGLPPHEIRPILAQLGYKGKTDNYMLVERVVDQLNQMVRDGKIVKRNLWVPADATTAGSN
jgi:hypothetical protein